MRKPNIGLCAICQRALKPGDSVRPVLSGMAHAAAYHEAILNAEAQ